MKTISKVKWLVACFSLLLFTHGSVAPAAQARAALQFRVLQKHLIVVSVFLNGDGAFDFVLDTSATTTVITPELAGRLGLRPTDRTELVTVSGSRIVQHSQLQSLTLDKKTLSNVDVLLDDLPLIRTIDSRICGFLGQNVLSQFNYLLDYRKGQIAFEEDGEWQNHLRGTRLPVERDEGRLFFILPPVVGRTRPLRFVLDSGVPGLVLFDAPSGKLDLEIKRNASAWITVSTNAGSRAVKSGLLPMLRVGEESFYNLPVALIPRSQENKIRSEDGLFPLCLFRSVYISKQFIIVNPRFAK
jgi:predicted aspartyl protease